MKRQFPLALAAIWLVLSTHSFAAPKPEPKEFVKFTTQKVIIFKDGYSLVIKKGKGKTDATGEIHTMEVPDAAVLGSFWATTPEAGALLGMRAGWREEESVAEIEEAALDNLAVLRANIGAECEIVTTHDEKHSGTIREVLVREGESAAQLTPAALSTSFVVPAGAGQVQPLSTTTTTATGTHFVLRTKAGDVLLAVASIRQLSIPEMNTKTTRTVKHKTRSKQLTFRFQERAKEHEITLMYFRPGVRWIPTYRIDLPKGKEKIAEVSLQAEILNEAEDLFEVPADIVVGVPNFRFRTTPSPLALESTLRNTLAQAEPVLMGQMRNDFSNAQYASRAGEFRRASAHAGPGGSGEMDLPGELTAGGAQDLFVYSLPNLRLRKGDRAAVSIFKAKVPYRDVYTWDLHLQREDIATAPSGAGIDSPLKLSTNKVWHQIELTNTTGVPWTTGAAMIMQGHQPLAQELLTYTSRKDACRVPVTVSVETRGAFSEKETDRKLNALKWDGYHYAKIDNEASFHLCNNKPSPIDVEITVKLGGRVSEASDEGKISLAPFHREDWNNYRGSTAVNNRSVVAWKVNLKPGDVFEPTINYSFYTRH